MGAIIRIYKKLFILLNSATIPEQMILPRRSCFCSQQAECINKLRLLFLSAQSGFVSCTVQVFFFTLSGLKSRLFICEGNDIIVDPLLLQLLQLFRCSFSVEGLGLHHGCVCHSCENKDDPLILILSQCCKTVSAQ